MKILLVCGLGRSGTSLLQSMLNAHPKIHFMREVHFLRNYAISWRRRFQWKLTGIQDLINELETDPVFERIEDREEVLVCLRRSTEAHDSIWCVYRKLAACVANEDAIVFGEKDPKILEDIKLICKELPGAKTIVMVRDPRAILASRLKAAWARKMPWWLQLMWIREQEKEIRAFRNQDVNGVHSFVRFEDLISDPKKVLADIAKSVGLEFAPAMLEFQESARTLIDKSELQWKGNTMRPLQVERTSSWRNILCPNQVMMTEIMCARWMCYWGYEAQSIKRGIRYLMFKVLSSGLLLFSPPLYRIRKLWEQIR